MKKKIPPLQFESKRFYMRPLRISDYETWKAAHLSAQTKQNEFDQERKSISDLTKKEFRKFLNKNETFQKENVIYYFGIFEKKTGRLLGNILFAFILRFNVQSARISYALFNNYWKHGFGKEAVSSAADFAFKKLKLHRVEAEIQPHNRASIALVKSIGFQSEGLRRGAVFFNRKWHDHMIYALLAEDKGIKDARPKILR